MVNNKYAQIAKIIIKKITGDVFSEEQSILDEWVDKSHHNREIYDRIISGKSRQWHQETFTHLDYFKTMESIKIKITRRRRHRYFIRLASSVSIATVMLVSIFYISIFNYESRDYNHSYEAVDLLNLPILTLPDGTDIILSDNDNSETIWKQYVYKDQDAIVNNEAQEELMMLKISIPRGAKEYKLVLDDGTIVWLNSGSFIKYPSTFSGNTRDVYLYGEVFIEVVPDHTKPFIVHTQDDLAITVLGTTFNVKSYPDATYSYITLVSGSVEVRNRDGCVRIKPREQLVINMNTQEMNVRQISDTNIYTTWINGVLLCNDLPLSEIFDAMERWYDIKIVCDIDDLSKFGKYTVKASRRDNFTTVLNVLQRLSSLHYQIDGKTIHITFPTFEE